MILHDPKYERGALVKRIRPLFVAIEFYKLPVDSRMQQADVFWSDSTDALSSSLRHEVVENQEVGSEHLVEAQC